MTAAEVDTILRVERDSPSSPCLVEIAGTARLEHECRNYRIKMDKNGILSII